MIKLKDLITEKLNYSKWHTGWDIIDAFDKIPQFKKYRVKDAQYDDMYFSIPTDVFTKVTGLTEKDVEKISNNLENYEGNISWDNEVPNKKYSNLVTVVGGA